MANNITIPSHETQNVVTLDVARGMAEEAANRAVAQYKTSTSNIGDDINIDREVKKMFYNKMSRPSFGDVIAEKIDGTMAEQLVAKIVPGLFGQNPATSNNSGKGVIGAVLDILNTQFAGQIGAGIGNNIPLIIQSLGQDRVGAIIDKFTGRPIGSGELSQEEQQRQIEASVMSLDSTNPNHVNSFMQATGLKDFNQAQAILLQEQDRILQKRGLARPGGGGDGGGRKDTSRNTEDGSGSGNKEKNDINRQLIEQYGGSPGNQPSPSHGSVGFFDDIPGSGVGSSVGGGVGGGIGGNVSERDFILSLNPDDSISQQEYMAYKKMSGVPLDEVKRFMIKEQKKLRDGLGYKGLDKSEVTDAVVIKDGDSWADTDLNKPVLKSIGNEVNKAGEIKTEGIKPEESRGIEQMSDNSELGTIMGLLQTIGENFDSNMKTMNDKISFLENKIVELESRKSSNEYNDINKDEKQINDVVDNMIISEVVPENIGEEENISDEEKKEEIIQEKIEPIIQEENLLQENNIVSEEKKEEVIEEKKEEAIEEKKEEAKNEDNVETEYKAPGIFTRRRVIIHKRE